MLPWETEGKTIRRCATWQLLALALMASGCASTAPQSPHSDPADHEAAAKVTKDIVTVENLLRWSLEGEAVGTNKVIAGLREVYKMEAVTDGYYAKGAKPLADNYVLSFVSIRNITGAIHIGLKGEPCYPAERAAAAISAVPDPVVEDAHGVDRGKSFKTTQNGVSVDFNTTPLTYRCVTSIHIKPTHKEKVP